ncbi:MAG: hypothetical protein AB1726_17880 [Planctomycetota bacterium]
MTRGAPFVVWLLLVVWGAWLFAVQGALASLPALGQWVPDAGLLLLLALDARLERREARIAAGLVALARVAFTADPPLAVLAGYLAVVWIAGRLREIVEIDRPLSRALLAGLLAAALSAFWIASRTLALGPAAAFPAGGGIVLRGALATAAAALLLPPLLARLPGLTPLGRRAA